jgi:protein gp37
MGDLFHHKIRDEQIYAAFDVMCQASAYQFQVLTKRPERMCNILRNIQPIRNIWLGVSIENQYAWNTRAEFLFRLQGWHKFVSFEPLIGPVDIHENDAKALDWVIIGGENGAGARPMEMKWALDIIDAVSCPIFFKGTGAVNKGKFEIFTKDMPEVT